jgi:lipoprotein-releasing system ATP-binding protein
MPVNFQTTLESPGSDLRQEPKSDAMTSEQQGLRVFDLRKSFESSTGQRIEVLCGVSFSVAPGEIVAIMGASGSGKSTLLQLLGGLDGADHGSILAGNFSVEKAGALTLAGYRNGRLGFIFQFHHLLPDLSAAENVALPLLIARRSRREALNRARKALKEVRLGGQMNQPVGHLSGGEQQRVAVCRALITEPWLVLADEPTGNLDPSIGQEIGAFLASYARTRRAVVVLATHNKRLGEFCDRILLLRDGRVYES